MSAAIQLVPLLQDEVVAQDYAKAILNILEDFTHDKVCLEQVQHAIVNSLEDFSQDKGRLEQTQRATLNLLEDLSSDKGRLEQTQHAVFNFLEDFSEDKGRLELTQRAMLNLLGDLSGDKARLEQTQHAIFNFLEDFSKDKGHLEQAQRAMLNLLDDFDAERVRAEGVSRELRDSMEQLRRAKEETESSNRELEAFSYSVSHDLRAPLRHISGFVGILTEEFGPSLPEEAHRHLKRIHDGTVRMGQLVDDLLNLARVGRRDLSLQSVSLKVLVEEVITTLNADLGERKVEWKLGDLPYIACDAGLIKQVFQNLLSNALKFTRPRQEAVIEIGQQERDGILVVFVRDNGVGFNMKYADKLFGVFQRLHRVEDFEGTGVGLATVQRIIQKHGGRIWADGELDKGATFRFSVGTQESEKKKVNATDSGDEHARKSN